MNYLDSLYWIHERNKFGIKPGTKRMEWMLQRLGNPENHINGIHVGGTNGKGSTVAYLRSALVENGYDVGTFTSPYIETFNERISLNGEPVSNDVIVELVSRVKPVSEALEAETEYGTATEFEIITTMMFLYFGEIRPVDFVVIEAGLGIKNDSTNVFAPIMSIITSIGLDHTDLLGSSYLDIAKDKGDIIKNHVPFVYAVKNEEALKYLREYAEKQDAPAYELDRDISIVSEEDEFIYRFKGYELENIALNMLGEHQKENAALAITALIILFEQGQIELDFNKMINAIEKVSWTGRIEKVKEEPLMIIDGAHNNESVDALIDTMKKYYDKENVDILFSAVSGKPISHMLEELKTISDHIYMTDFDFHRAKPKEEIAAEAETFEPILVDNYVDFIENYQGDALIITGSLYFISEVKAKVNFNS
ncbi:bifunctional folylpolyglutamate synthase/dihydrofolate synthase [Staphylococcus carnosus]|uniref:bifunctional folylpolyglutamate synthase/dihydrofolate synthase n=1 Tax=Staphylococcus carnosus TaxID=1281 RepID=UPI000CD110D5|nr:folylpolyglutamate synthase/dihydrofolate synthase family protein [Staphylococcus carnosus]POA06097.1 bifunctional folylpolyglutamate synthase/dihydrofolate synthase [Staphylococcus carnosus]QRQ04993.1 bifunctional folylpolyglutamate synthase/dihydrofolate synthase [Staphylococcus carnosus]UTB83010.1 bifunctional folylpolyglutamate synthase/dihydrofolate synthase [Staphylococcus carnosus]SUM06207.1 folylpolyglutamate synthase [Staphylococcus carnosus]GEP78609.1 bifunctional folylpolyglutama